MEGWAETEFCHPPPNSYAEALTPSVTVFGDRPFREISKIKWYVCKKVALKLNIQKTKIMSSGPITLWQMNWETVETVADFIFLGSKITADGDCSHEIKSHLLLGRKVKMNLDSILKSRDITLPTKVHQVQFSSVQFSHSVVSDSLRPHEPHHARPPCPSPTPRVHPNPCPLCWWYHPTMSSSIVPLSSCPQSHTWLLKKIIALTRLCGSQ